MRYIALAFPAFVIAAMAQAPPPQVNDGTAPVFEVASVKTNKGGPRMMMSMRTLPGRLEATNLPLRMLITQAYRVPAYLMQGGPAWLDSDRFDLVAKAPDGSPPDRTMLMLRALLAERFKLVVHNETKDAPIYALVMARSDGKLGPKLTKTTDDCEAILAERRAAARARGPGPVAFTPPPPNEKPICTINMSAAPGTGGLPVMRFRAGGQTLDSLTRQLASMVSRPVVDRTGLTGLYDFEIEFSPPRPLSTAGGATATTGAAPTAPLDDGPTIFESVQQLGLKLESTRGPVEYVVIDSVERPIDD